MMKVLYLAVPDCVPDTFSVWLKHGTYSRLLGFVRRSTDGWKARKRSAPEVHSGFKVCSEATSFLAVERRFAKPRATVSPGRQGWPWTRRVSRGK
jgi:hypothetical protein